MQYGAQHMAYHIPKQFNRMVSETHPATCIHVHTIYAVEHRQLGREGSVRHSGFQWQHLLRVYISRFYMHYSVEFTILVYATVWSWLTVSSSRGCPERGCDPLLFSFSHNWLFVSYKLYDCYFKHDFLFLFSYYCTGTVFSLLILSTFEDYSTSKKRHLS